MYSQMIILRVILKQGLLRLFLLRQIVEFLTYTVLISIILLTDSFTYQVQDAYGTLSNTGTVTLDITCNPPPVGVEDFFTVDQYSQNNPLDILSNDTAIDGDHIYFSDVISYTSNGFLDIYNNRD